MGANLLSLRLKELEAANIIQHRKLPPPAATSVYELTEFGGSLRGIIHEMTLWGLQFLKPEKLKEDYLSAVALKGSMTILFDDARASGLSITGEVHTEGDVLALTVGDSSLAIDNGHHPDPAFVVETEPRVFAMILLNILSVDDAMDTDQLSLIAGDAASVSLFSRAFRMPDTA